VPDDALYLDHLDDVSHYYHFMDRVCVNSTIAQQAVAILTRLLDGNPRL
jgi:hypothetical protein